MISKSLNKIFHVDKASSTFIHYKSYSNKRKTIKVLLNQLVSVKQ